MLSLPIDVTQVFAEFRTCEFTTLNRRHVPVTWPTLPFYDQANGEFVITTSIALTDKVANVRRNPCVALLYSDPTASALNSPPMVLIEGRATAPDEILTSIRGSEEALAQVFQRQPNSAIYSSNALMRYFFDWYYMRLVMRIKPVRIRWWPGADLSQPAQVWMPATVPESGPPPSDELPTAAPGPVWDSIDRHLPRFSTGVVTCLGTSGYPASTRCTPRRDGRVAIVLEGGAVDMLCAGPASLLCHRHDHALWNLYALQLQGWLAYEDLAWRFYPRRFLPGQGADGPLGLLKFALRARRNAARYLAQRNLPRPTIPWDEIIAVKTRALGPKGTQPRVGPGA